MSAWVKSSFMDAIIVLSGERPWGVADGTAPLSGEDAASYVSDWFGNLNNAVGR